MRSSLTVAHLLRQLQDHTVCLRTQSATLSFHIVLPGGETLHNRQDCDPQRCVGPEVTSTEGPAYEVIAGYSPGYVQLQRQLQDHTS